jgi:hypothetical protein
MRGQILRGEDVLVLFVEKRRQELPIRLIGCPVDGDDSL